jgi:subtilisin family serine protease
VAQSFARRSHTAFLTVTLMLALFGASCAQVHSGLDETPTSVDKIPARLEQELRAGLARDVLVQLVEEDDLPTRALNDAGVGVQREKLVRDLGSVAPSIANPMIDEQVEARAKYYTAAQDSVLNAVDDSAVELHTRYENLPFMFVRVNTLQGLFALANCPEVLRLHEERFLEHQLAESLPLIHQPQALAMGKTGAGTAVAVLDTGADYTRPELGSCSTAGAAGCKVAFAADFATDDKSLDDNGHGTNVSAIVLGVAPATKVLALDVFQGPTAPSSAILSALDWTIKNRTTYNIVALNMSLGGAMYNAVCGSDLFAAPLTNVRAAGILPAVASGNNGYTGALASPACTPAAISVGAVYDANVGGISYASCSDTTTGADKITCFSNSASFLSVLAPGALITAGGYRMAGTSQASPHVAGAIAVLRAAFPNEAINTTVSRIVDNGPSLTDPRNQIVKHRLDVLAALGGAATISDNSGPTGSVLINNGAVATTSTSVMLKLSGSDPSGVTSMCISNSGSCTAFETFATSKAWTLLGGDGTKTVRVALKDGAGNQSVMSATIKLDTTAPVGGTLRASAGDRQVTLAWTAAADSGSGVSSYRVVSAPAAAPSCTSGTLVYNGPLLTFTHTGLTNGNVYAYRLCPVDSANNIGAGSTATARPAPEFTPPTGSITINGGGPLTNKVSVTLTLSASDPSGVSGMCISNSTTCTAWLPFTNTKIWSLATANGPTKVYAWFKDKYENVSAAPMVASVTVDAAPPTGGIFNGVGGSKQVTLSWTAATDPSGIDSYKLVFAPGKAAPSTCTQGLVAYSGPSLTFVHTNLLANTNYSYRLCAFDKAGNATLGLTRTVLTR